MSLLEKTVWQQTVILAFLENCAKEIVRQTKNEKFNELAKGEYFKTEKRRNPWMLERANIVTPFMDSTEKQYIFNEYEK